MKKRQVTATQRDDSSRKTTFEITDKKLYVPVVTLSSEDDNK